MHWRSILLPVGFLATFTFSACLGAEVAAETIVRVAQTGPGDFRGDDETPILAAAERLADRGGTIEIGPGEYLIRRPIRLVGGIAVRGSGETVLRLPPPTRLTEAAPQGQEFVLVEDSSSFGPDTQVQIVPAGEKAKPGEKPQRPSLTVRQVLPGKLVFTAPLPCDVPVGSGIGYSHNLLEIRGSRKNIRIERLTIDGGRKADLDMPGHMERCAVAAAGPYSYQGGPSAPPVENLEILDCKIRNCYGRGVAMYSVVRSKVANCLVEDIADEAVDLDHFCYHCEVADNTIRRAVTGVTINDGSFCTVARNRIVDCGVGVNLWWWHMCPQTDIDVENVIRDNTILGSRGPAISIGKRCFRNRVIGNRVDGEIKVAEPDNVVEGNVQVQEIQGTVRGEGEPLSGVLVSDGCRVARTDAAGKYRLETGPDSGRFMFVSLPSGYWTDDFYVPLETAAAAGRADFALRRIEQPDRFDFVFLADFHLENRGPSQQKFRSSLREICELDPKPAFALCQGDISLQGGVGGDYVECLKELTIPVRNGPGNHEMILSHPNPRDDYQRLFGPTYYSFDYGQVHCIVLDGNKPIPDGKDYKAVHGAVEGSELAWLRADLAAQPEGRPTIVGIHIPIVTTYPQRRRESPPEAPYWEVANRDVLTDLFAEHGVRLVLQGHMHENEREIVQGVEYVESISISGSWWRSGAGMERGVDGVPRGYRIVSVDGTKITHRYRSSSESRVDRRGEFLGLEKPLPLGPLAALVFNCYDAPNGSTAEARIGDGPWQPMPAFAAVNEWLGLEMPHHFRLQADTAALGPGRHTVHARVRWEGDEVVESAEFEIAASSAETR